MGDKDHRHAEFLLQPAQQHDDLDLHGDVECGGGLVGEQHRRAAGQRQRDHRPLPHSARHFVRVGFEAARCRGDLHDLQEFERPAGGAGPGDSFVADDRLGDLLADREHRVERHHRLLKDHCYLGAAHLAQLGFAEAGDLVAGDGDAALDLAATRRK